MFLHRVYEDSVLKRICLKLHLYSEMPRLTGFIALGIIKHQKFRTKAWQPIFLEFRSRLG